MLIEKIKTAIGNLHALSANKPIKVISHFDTDGITSAAIMARTLSRWNKKFSLQIVKSLTQETIESLPEDHILLFLDLASNSLDHLSKKKTEIFILDHHEIIQDLPSNTTMINPHLEKEPPMSSAGICYLFSKEISKSNIDLANLAILGMVGDFLERNLSKDYQSILEDSETTVKKGLLVYPATRPLDKALEYSSNPYIPGVSGSYKGALEVLKEADIPKINNKYKSLYELSEEEMSNLLTAVLLRCKNHETLIGNLYLVKFFNKQEDARELSALINACSRMGSHSTALGFCLGNKTFKEEAEKLYISYKQHLIAALKHIQSIEKITGNQYTIINAQDKVKDTIIGTVTSIISNSPTYQEGTIIIGLAYNQDKIKVSARIAGRSTDKNVREILNTIVEPLGGEVGGHQAAAGCLIEKNQESLFINELQKSLEIKPN